MHRRWTRVLGAVFALTLLTAACGGDDPETTPDQNGGSPNPSPDATPTDGGGADLTIVSFAFSPTDLTISEGDTITVSNISDTSHTFTTDDEAVDETIGAGEEVEVPLEGVSSGGFHCRFHSQMTGTLTVE
jgi:plastocyanin